MKSESHVLQCPFCHSRAMQHWSSVNVCVCSSCELLFRYPQKDLVELTELYTASWADPEREIEETGATDSALAKIYADRLVQSLGFNSIEGMRLLDFGAGKGSIMEAFAQLGAEIYGVEPFGYGYLHNKGYAVYPSLDSLPPDLSFNGIVTFDVIEHLVAPWEYLMRLKKHLSSNGWMLVTTPNALSLNALVMQSNWREVSNRGHLYFFTQKTLANMLNASGYKRFSRVKWFVPYHNSWYRRMIDKFLQFTALDGELRFIAWNEE